MHPFDQAIHLDPLGGHRFSGATHPGYFDQTAEIWSDDNQLLASSHQMVYFRE